MTITLTPIELANFQAKLSDWYEQRLQHVVNVIYHAPEQLRFDPERVRNSLHEFERSHPIPDWKTLI